MAQQETALTQQGLKNELNAGKNRLWPVICNYQYEHSGQSNPDLLKEGGLAYCYIEPEDCPLLL